MSLEYDITRIMVEAATLDDHGDGLVTLRIDTKAAGRILALIRERLTSEAAVEAGLAASYLTPPDVDWTVGERRCMSNTLTAALDAITGETR